MTDPCRFPSSTYDTAATPCHQMHWFLSGFCQLKPPFPSFFFWVVVIHEKENGFFHVRPSPLPLLLTLCLKLHESPLEPFSVGQPQDTISLLSITTFGFSVASLLAPAPLAVRSFLASKISIPFFVSKIFLTIYVKRVHHGKFFLVFKVLIVQG